MGIWLSKGLFLMLMCSGCVEQNIQDSNLRDHVLACGAGFSDELQANLSDSLLIHSIQNTFHTGFKAQAKAMIFEEMPPEDRLKAYEDYINCIEKEPEYNCNSEGTPQGIPSSQKNMQ